MFDQYGQPTGGYGQITPFLDTKQYAVEGQPGRPPNPSPLASAIAGQGLSPGQPAKVNPPAPPSSPLAAPSASSIHDYMLGQLKMGKNPQQVAQEANQKFGRTKGNEAVYYPDNNTIGLPDSYLAGPTNRPDSPKEWGIKVREQQGHAAGGPGGGFLSMLMGGMGRTPQTVSLEPTNATGGISPLLTAVMGQRQY